VQDGQLLIEIEPTLVLDWQGRFSGSGPFAPFLRSLDEFYRKYIIKYTIVDYWEDMCLLKSLHLLRVVKQTLGQEVM
jgi:hypothetical protein